MADGAQIKRGRKFDQVLEGAREIFLAHGFEGASVDEIAKAAGVSKATLYSYFPDKRLLFIEVAKSEYERQADAAMEWLGDDCTTEKWLTHGAEIMLDAFLTDFSKGVHRMAVAEADRFPDLAQGFYESGPLLIRRALTPFFEEAEARGDLKIEDKELAADQFAELCKSGLVPRFQFGIQDSFTDAERRRVIDGAVKTFMARYGA